MTSPKGNWLPGRPKALGVAQSDALQIRDHCGMCPKDPGSAPQHLHAAARPGNEVHEVSRPYAIALPPKGRWPNTVMQTAHSARIALPPFVASQAHVRASAVTDIALLAADRGCYRS